MFREVRLPHPCLANEYQRSGVLSERGQVSSKAFDGRAASNNLVQARGWSQTITSIRETVRKICYFLMDYRKRRRPGRSLTRSEPGREILNDPRTMLNVVYSSISLQSRSPLVSIAECNFYLAGDLAVLSRDDQLDLSKMILRQAVIEDLEHAIDAPVEFPFIGF